VGAHILSGNVFEPRALDELIPDWKEQDAPLGTPVTSDSFKVLTSESSSFSVPEMFFPKQISNHGNHIISLSELSQWLGERAEEAGVEILPGFAGESVLEDTPGVVNGVMTGAFGIGKDGKKKDNYQAGMRIVAK
jgi:electron-transferring-flavoprotein dehydrogenase